MSSESNGVVLITGGSRGIGFGTARVMGREGWQVAITATSEENLARASARLAEEGIQHHSVCFRIEDEDAWP
ncbi:MAG: SDR family NAD(P)-dependent oxidoreductase, partial [Acidiferrobacterales bacterium]